MSWRSSAPPWASSCRLIASSTNPQTVLIGGLARADSRRVRKAEALAIVVQRGAIVGAEEGGEEQGRRRRLSCRRPVVDACLCRLQHRLACAKVDGRLPVCHRSSSRTMSRLVVRRLVARGAHWRGTHRVVSARKEPCLQVAGQGVKDGGARCSVSSIGQRRRRGLGVRWRWRWRCWRLRLLQPRRVEVAQARTVS